MRKLIDHGLCKLPFEEKWFRERGCNVFYVGHPYFDELTNRSLDHQFIKSLQSHPAPLITLLPGSRNQEVTGNLPNFFNVIHEVRRELPNVRFAIASFKDSQSILAREMAAERNIAVEVYCNRTPELIESADVCLACSGSVSLELLYHAKPSIIQYKISRLAFRLQDRFRIARYITLVNLLDADDIERKPGEHFDPDEESSESVPMPEYLTWQDCSESIAKRIIQLVSDKAFHESHRERLQELRSKYAKPGASQRAAEYISRTLSVSESSPVPRPHFLKSRPSTKMDSRTN
jgi:lipid-A-disaccharide synthase